MLVRRARRCNGSLFAEARGTVCSEGAARRKGVVSTYGVCGADLRHPGQRRDG